MPGWHPAGSCESPLPLPPPPWQEREREGMSTTSVVPAPNLPQTCPKLDSGLTCQGLNSQTDIY
ncbi:hypothetical protein FIBSPDRAFT_848558, partial [Athelia psychrophila]